MIVSTILLFEKGFAPVHRPLLAIFLLYLYNIMCAIGYVHYLLCIYVFTYVIMYLLMYFYIYALCIYVFIYCNTFRLGSGI